MSDTRPQLIFGQHSTFEFPRAFLKLCSCLFSPFHSFPSEEAYFQFQFGPAGIRNEIGTIVLAMRGSFDDIAIADWLVRSNPALRGERPLDRLLRTQATATVLEALHATAPESATETAAAAVTDPATVRAQLVSPHRRGLRRPHRPISGRTAASH